MVAETIICRSASDCLSSLLISSKVKECLKEFCTPEESYIEKGNIQFLLDDTQSACRSWNQGRVKKDWENQFKLENIGNDSIYSIYKDFCS